MADKTLYNEKSIESLTPLEFTRLRPGVYAGDTTYSTQLLVEIISNSVDEYRLNHGNKIEVTINGDIVKVRDYGQGFIANSYRPDGKTILEAAFSVLNTSGKYRDDGTYEGTSLGSFGIGSKITTFLSHWLIVSTYRDSQREEIHFKEGVFNKRYDGAPKSLEAKEDVARGGTEVTWQPSEEFFTHTEVDISAVKDLFKTISCLCPGLTIELDYNGEKTTYYSQNGLNDLVDGIVKDKEAISNRFQMNFENGKNKMDMVMTYVSSYSSIMIPYVNTGLTEKGPHITQIKTLLTREFNKFFREKNWLKEKDANLSGEDIQEGLCVVFNITASNVSYNAQVKSTITKIDMAPFTTALTENLQDWLKVNEKEVKIIADKALSARKAREAAKKAREAARAPKEKGLKAKMALSDKFIDCVSKSPKERKLFLLEGLSAGAAAVEARNPKTDCIYLLRGKIISPLKNDTTKILANQEMSDLVKIIGGGFGADFDLSKCNFDKIVIFSDSDSDGDQICLLLMGFFYTYMRPLVEAGKLYRGAAPLYTVKQGKEERYFYTDKEYRDWFSTATGKFSVLRGKGVGELEATDLHRLCFATERFKRLCVSDLEQTTKMLDIFLGTAVVPRRNYIYDNAEDLGFNME